MALLFQEPFLHKEEALSSHPPPRLWRVPLRGLGDSEGGPSQLRTLDIDIFPFLERLLPLVAAACLLGSLWQMPEAPLTSTMQSTAAVVGLGQGRVLLRLVATSRQVQVGDSPSPLQWCPSQAHTRGGKGAM